MRHPLREFYIAERQLPDGRMRYAPKRLARGGEVFFEYDHIIPAALGGIDHPKNYMVIHRRFNKSFSNWWTREKADYVTLLCGRDVVPEVLRVQRGLKASVERCPFVAQPDPMKEKTPMAARVRSILAEMNEAADAVP